MIFFITFLRCLAACFITNSHYTGIYPTDLIANGGLIGDVLFFAVSGYCLYNVKLSFPKWYGKRLYRVYPPVLIMTAVYMLCGAYSLADHGIRWWYLYPTYYHFVASIVVLYIPYYFCMKLDGLKKHLLFLMGVVAIISLLLYLTVYDKSYYHIDKVREPLIRFLFMECMLLGAWFRQNDKRFRNQFKRYYPFVTVGIFMLYFASKLIFSRRESLSKLQFLNWIAIVCLLIYIFITFASLDEKLEKLPAWSKKGISFVSDITLEIYLVQYVLIDLIRPFGRFPLNWFILTGVILLLAYLLHVICNLFYKVVEKMAKRLGGKER
ncbi:acyltransferase family protein [[Clostridium] polysaccharolyticum]|uniref:Peptidoglycan/LPS O-acetylase OafA/YrhL, contains acyltransferase and SGNH-hydrolase domains n=1 Tax=[Clostridium] polysaccharolyticum TaxID=29364 RepID=A0A1H9ZBD6_9FIRM|nr:acyltransferase [[Clostridium] polysaccharolyticum]SES78926.1 Peptidoglycan/LPS O-acetylase OafA/YrhL, contains acyltransferase and SGNH-hydrolase domains [[Clostridium] polysaccharolyticum]